MRIQSRIAAVGAVLALAGGGMFGAAAPASASSTTADLSCDAWRYQRGASGRHGASITCYGSSFTGYVVCHKPDGYMYGKLGNRARSGGTSTAWCDVNAEAVDAGAFPD
ncbi:hypothetical protein ACH4U6_21835 [Streptomyces netropsis]|uniref:hypothetical protein n=1 Tax=Streptomyces netropsis TaxID=55404 RepID=UPI0037B79831